MDIKKAMKLFNEYAKTYDLKVKPIMEKFHHSYRVAEFAKEIACHEKLSKEEIDIAYISALFHDIARFDQWTKYQTFKDSKSVDHGDLGYDILKEKFISDITPNKEIQDIILLSTKYHNKYCVDKNLNKKQLLFCNIIRDADKIDIMIEQHISIKENKIVIKEELLKSIYDNKTCENKYMENEVDAIIRMISWINDLNFKSSFKIIKEKDIINKKFALLEIYGKQDII